MATNKLNLIISDRLELKSKIKLQQNELFNITESSDPSLKDADLSQTEVLLIRSKTKIDKNLIERAPKLKLVVTSTSGFDHIDIELCKSKKIQVAHTPEAHINSTAELTWSLAMACARHTLRANTAVKSGDWQKDIPDGFEFSGKTYGVIGLGRIGSRVAEIAKAFNMHVVAYDPYCDDSNFKKASAKRVGLEEALKLSDVISLHVPLTPETRNLISDSTLEYIQRNSILINTSRGGVVDEFALCKALEKGWLKAAALDVYAKEPLGRDSQLLRAQNLVLSPHLGARTAAAFECASNDAVSEILSWSRGEGLKNELPPDAHWYTTPKGFN